MLLKNLLGLRGVECIETAMGEFRYIVRNNLKDYGCKYSEI